MPNLNDFAILSNSAVGKRIPDSFANTQTPKYKFNFLIKFEFRSFSARHTGSEDVMTNEFAVKQMGRPNPVINYQDVNYYGFRTKVPTRIDFSVFNVSFYDDGEGRSHSIFEEYMKAISPLVRIENSKNVQGAQTIIELPDDDFLGPIDHIDLIHFHQGKDTIYRFHNPKITNFLLDELDMTQSEVSSVSMAFVYDAFHMIKSHEERAKPSEPEAIFFDPNNNAGNFAGFA